MSPTSQTVSCQAESSSYAVEKVTRSGARTCWWRVTLIMITMPMVTVTFSFFPAQQRKGQHRHISSCHATPLTAADTGDDLTKEELGLRLSEVRDYYRKTNEMSQENVCLSLLRTRLPKLRLNRCYVAQSTISNAGRGLFASRDILDGELITLYPGDALLVWNETVGDFGGEVGVMFGSHVQGEDRNANRVSTDEARGFELKIGPKHSIVGDPLLTSDAAYLGHMANDGAILTKRDNEARELYSKTTVARHNAAFFVLEGSHFVAVATKRIRQDEEIFVSYGEGYWLSRSYSTPGVATSGEAAGAVVTKLANIVGTETKSGTTYSKKIIGKKTKQTRAQINKKGFGK